jgi:hypothetical protein
MRYLCALTALSVLAASAGVIDRAALIVGKTVYTESEVENEARLTEFEAGKPLDLSAAARKEAANRLIDRELLRQEMSATGFQPPSIDADALLRSFVQQHHSSSAQFRAALARYGVTEDELKERLVWEVTLLRFIDQRFKPLATLPETTDSANRSENPESLANSVDQQMDAWLQQQRADTRIVFVPEAFQ